MTLSKPVLLTIALTSVVANGASCDKPNRSGDGSNASTMGSTPGPGPKNTTRSAPRSSASPKSAAEEEADTARDVLLAGEKVLEATVSQLLSELKASPEKFKSKYFLNTVQVTGVLNKMDDTAGLHVLQLTGKLRDPSVPRNSVRCQYMSGSKPKGALKRGQKITVRGMMGTPIAGVVRVQACKIVK